MNYVLYSTFSVTFTYPANTTGVSVSEEYFRYISNCRKFLMYFIQSNKLKKKQLNKILKNELRTFWIFDVLFYRRHVLEITDGFESPGGVKWDITLCNLLAWTIIFIVLSKGIKTLGKVRYAEEERIFLKRR